MLTGRVTANSGGDASDIYVASFTSDGLSRGGASVIGYGRATIPAGLDVTDSGVHLAGKSNAFTVTFEPDGTTSTVEHAANLLIASYTFADENSPRAYVKRVAKKEGAAGAVTSYTFDVWLTKASASAVTVAYVTANGEATAGSDYTATSGTLTFAAGDLIKTITVNATGDATIEGDERFYLDLTVTGSDVIGGTTRVTGYILNDDVKPGGKKLTAASAGSNTDLAPLSEVQVQSLLPEALARWNAAGVDTSGLVGLSIRIADLDGTTLGLAAGNTLWLDDDAAGWGWFVDPTPWDDSEFALADDQGEQNRMDLLTAVMHEMGHVLGHDHEDDGVMQEALSAGSRWLLSEDPLVENQGQSASLAARDRLFAAAPEWDAVLISILTQQSRRP